ncbi:MAG: hypothetical protein JWO38_5253 [Gemmataceae bacterium]|nr:hypothetical protein [Gemmataceae bacterium]
MPSSVRTHLGRTAPLLLLVVAATGVPEAKSFRVAPTDDPALVPWPRTVTVGGGEMPLTAGSRVVAGDAKLIPLARILAGEIERATGLPLVPAGGPAADGDIELAFDPALTGEAYSLTVAARAAVRGGDYDAVAQGTVTLLQALRNVDGRVHLPRLKVEDRPTFTYRGAMLDVARKPHSIATLKQCVEVCRFYKIRYLQLHMTDENAWTFPSTAFPKLGSENFAWAGGEKPTVYKLDELRELVAYADARGVTLVPELEVPGHSGHLRGTLPEVFGYTDAAGKTVTLGVVNIVREEAFQALDTLAGEAAAIFRSSPFIHFGCDEASLGGVAEMPEVKAFMARHKLDSADAVFNAFVNRLHAIGKKHGKRVIVWEGAPLHPAAPPKDLVVMPWVGGSTLAERLVKDGYGVVNAPWGVKGPQFDPFLVNGARVLPGEPALLGATLLLWQQPQDAAVPFLRQIGGLRAEPTYNPDTGRGLPDLVRRLRATDPLLDRLLAGCTVRTAGAFESADAARLDVRFTDPVRATLDTALRAGAVRYTLDGGEPTATSRAYTAPIPFTRSATLKARWFSAAGVPGPFPLVREVRRLPTVRHAAVGAAVTFTPTQPGYYGPGPKGLTDGLHAEGDEAASAGWVGWERGGEPVRVVVDLGQAVKVRSLAGHFLRAGGGIDVPDTVSFELSADGKEYTPAGRVGHKTGLLRGGWFVADVPDTSARFVRLTATAGGDWTFLDEVAVNPVFPGPDLRHAALGRPVVLAHPPADVYSAPGVGGLTDGVVGRSPDFLNPQWLGVEGKNIDATIDLGRVIEVREVGANFLQYVGAGIQIPGVVDVFVSEDGKAFARAGTIKHAANNRAAYIETLRLDLAGVKARFVRVVAHTNGQWLFADELFVNRDRSGE